MQMVNIPMNQTEFEQAIIAALCTAPGSISEKLIAQANHINVEKRESSDQGFFTYFSLEYPDENKLGLANFTLGDVEIICNGIRNAIGVVLIIRDGVIFCLEGYTLLADHWPSEYIDIEIIKKEGKDIKTLQQVQDDLSN